jgi:hypothetical protein
MAPTVRGAICELMEQTMATMDALLEASDRELTMPSSHACALGKDGSHHERHRSREDPHRRPPHRGHAKTSRSKMRRIGSVHCAPHEADCLDFLYRRTRVR